MTGLYILIALLAAVFIWWLVSLIWGKPWNIKHLYAREFLRMAFDSPELLTMLGMLEKLGIHGHNAKLADVSQAREDRNYARLQRALRWLRSYNRNRQNNATLLSTDIMDWFLDDQARSERFRHHDYPVNQMFGMQSSLPNFMMTMHPVISRLEGRNYVKRLSRFNVRIDQLLEGLWIREAKGILPPRFVIRHVLNEMNAFIGQPANQNPLYVVFKDKLSKLEKVRGPDREKLLAATEIEIQRTVYPAYQKLIDYFTGLEKKATTDDGIWKLPDGEAYYTHCLRSNTSTDYTPDQVHEIGLKEVARIEAEMMKILAGLGFKGIQSAPKKLAELGKEERFLYPNTAEGRMACLAEYQRILDEINAGLEDVFDVRPKARLNVERVPEFREKTSAGAYYQPGAMGGGRPGVFYANLRDMSEVHMFGMKTLSYHEGIPGHHFQIAIAQELKGVPFFRRLIPFTAYAEGWALYAEKLAREIGFYKDDPYGELGYLDSELFRAVRLVVDTGIHYKRWTREQAIEYMEAHTASAHESVVSEVERYIVMPGQACAYKIGEIKMVELREKVKQALGDQFDLRKFHNVVLKSGSMPLSILEQVIEEYVRSEE
ncbi:MAG: DUF885 domain-containing protein [Chloroflexota bacterium]